MGFENKYPYTDFHEMNLDWILEVVKGIETEWPEFRTEMQTAWQQYQDNLTGEGGEWPTFRDEMTQDFDDFIHLFIDEFDNMHAYTVGDYVVQDGQVYKCEALPSPSHALPIEFDEYTWLRISNGVINQFSHEIMAIESSVKTFVERMVPEYSDQEYYNKAMIVRKASTFAPTFPYDFYIAKQLITPETWTPSHWERVNSFAQAINDVCAINKQEMQDQYDQFLEDYQRTFGVVQTRGSSTTDVMSQKAVSDELQALDAMFDNLIKDIAPVYDSTKAYKIGNLLTYLGKQYYCIADAPAGTLPTNTAYFEEKSVADIIEMIKNGSIVTGHSEVADNLTPYSEDSGTTQEEPFISQGTGTDNNSVIVTTGVIARQLEKQGNTPAVNQKCPALASGQGWKQYNYVTTYTYADGVITLNASSNADITNDKLKCTAGHRYLVRFKINTSNNSVFIKFGGAGGNTIQIPITVYQWNNCKIVVTANISGLLLLQASNGTQITDYYVHDLDQWGFSSDIITDLTSHPEHFSWYYNGSLAYDAGSLQNCNGRYLECGQGRNLFDQEWEQGAYNTDTGAKENNTFKIRSKNRYLVTPLLSYYFGQNTVNTGTFRVFQYDKDGNYLGNIVITARGTFTVVANCRWISFQCADSYGTTYKNDISIELYYTPEQGGEGYGEMHDYVAPIRIDTGNEELLAFDRKLPSGVIERITGEVDLGTLAWSYNDYLGSKVFVSDGIANRVRPRGANTLAKCAIYVNSWKMFNEITISGSNKEFGFAWDGNLYVRDTAYTDASTFKSAMNGVYLQYELKDALKTTEQGTPFSEYAPINDYSYMCWLDNDGNLVSIPQGCKLFYPVDYKGFVDDLVMYTNGDATALAKNEDITDTALNARGYYKMQDLSSGITDVAGLTYVTKKAVQQGNYVTMIVRARNTTGSSISANTTLFTTSKVPTAITIGYANLNTSGDTNVVIETTGNIYLGKAMDNNEFVTFSITYYVA